MIFAVLALGTAVGCAQNDGTTATAVPVPASPATAGTASTNDPGLTTPTAADTTAANDPDPTAVQAQARQVPQRERGRGFVPLDDPVFLAANETGFFGDDELVLGVEFAGEVRAYPVRMLRYHHIVNDTVGGEPLLVTY